MTQITGQILNYFNLLMTHYRAEENTKDFSIYCARVSRDAVCVHWHDRLQVESHWDNERVTWILRETINTSRIKERKESRISGKDFTVVADVKTKLCNLEELILKLRLVWNQNSGKKKNTVIFKRNQSQEKSIHH